MINKDIHVCICANHVLVQGLNQVQEDRGRKKHLVVHTCAHKIEVRLVWFEGECSPTVCVGRT